MVTSVVLDFTLTMVIFVVLDVPLTMVISAGP